MVRRWQSAGGCAWALAWSISLGGCSKGPTCGCVIPYFTVISSAGAEVCPATVVEATPGGGVQNVPPLEPSDPCSGYVLGNGTHTVTVSAPGFQTVTQTITVATICTDDCCCVGDTPPFVRLQAQ